ncbi:MAG: inositol monophosphatase family protein [Phycisphaerae bacterium]|jgi:fructose-1,6-bisphosphatase/inositol monophosphatase family enzyme|nr:inositol monophosphatase family protein [Phycisphaerae bacterium]
MDDKLFARRMKNWESEGELCAFNLACVAEALDTVKRLSDQNVGWEVVEKRVGEYKNWDPDILKVDKETEGGYWKRLEQRGSGFLFLSEEAGTVEINKDAEGEKYNVVCDPFDGSYLFKHGIPAFWYSSLALYGEDLKPACCAVGDCFPQVIAFANDNGAFVTELDGDRLVHKVRLDKKYRQSMGRPDVTTMKGASIESYAMKPTKFLMPLVDEYRDLLEPFKFINPNGGPYGFVDVAEGKIDCYFARKQPFVDVFSGIYVAQQAEVIVTDFDGKAVEFVAEEETVWDVVATTNQALHDEVLAAIADCKKKMGQK